MTVMKFGGAVLREPDGFRRMVRILRKASQGPILVIVSAFATATRDLEFASRLAQRGLITEAEERLHHVIEDHFSLVRALLPVASSREGIESLLREAKTLLATLLKGVSTTQQLTARTLDRILAHGEYFALHIARHVLQDAGLDVVGIDAQNIIVTSDDYGMASPLADKSAIHVHHELIPALNAHAIVVMQGFVGRTEDGASTTMGKESSNLTATFLASLIGAKEVVIWTDVEGVRSADPHQFEHTSSRPHLSYSEARIAAQEGLKLLHPTMIEPSERAGIPIRIASAYRPDGQSTIIDGNAGTGQPIVIVRVDDNVGSIATVCIDVPQWLMAATRVTQSLHDLCPFDVNASQGARTAVLRVSNSHVLDVAQQLHRELSTSTPST